MADTSALLSFIQGLPDAVTKKESKVEFIHDSPNNSDYSDIKKILTSLLDNHIPSFSKFIKDLPVKHLSIGRIVNKTKVIYTYVFPYLTDIFQLEVMVKTKMKVVHNPATLVYLVGPPTNLPVFYFKVAFKNANNISVNTKYQTIKSTLGEVEKKLGSIDNIFEAALEVYNLFRDGLKTPPYPAIAK